MSESLCRCGELLVEHLLSKERVDKQDEEDGDEDGDEKWLKVLSFSGLARYKSSSEDNKGTCDIL